MRRFLVLIAFAAAATVASTASADTGGFTHLTQIGRVRFPERSFLLDLPPATRVSRSQITIFENGKRVRRFSFAPIQSVDGRFGVVLVVDASNSMRGAPSRAALAAARTFVRRVGPGEQIGLVTFNRATTVLAHPTAGNGTLGAALAKGPQLAQGTHIYDAIDEGLRMLRESDVSSGSIVLLSDGADTGSQKTEHDVATRAAAAHVRVFSVGLRSRSYEAAPLRRLAEDTGGSYSEAASIAELSSIYSSLGRQLSTEYVLGYRSAVAPHSRVSVVVRLRGVGDVAASYTAPTPAPIAPFHRSLFERFWSSPASMVFFALMAAALAAFGAVLLLRVQKGTLMTRIADFVTMAPADKDESSHRAFSSRLLSETEESLSKTEWWARFNEELEIARISIPAVRILFGAAVATLVAAIVLYLISPVFAFFAVGVPFLVRALVRRKLKAVRDDFAEQLPDNLQVLASALRAGHSFVGALAVVARDAPEPAQREFRRVVADEQLGVPMEESLREVTRRMASVELEQVALVAELQRESGGNMAEVLDTVVETIRDRFDLRRLVKTLTAQGRLARWILTVLPAFLAFVITLLNPNYMRPLFGSTAGQVMLALSAVMVIAGSLVIKRIVNIKV
jgi:tight adherence protein B